MKRNDYINQEFKTDTTPVDCAFGMAITELSIMYDLNLSSKEIDILTKKFHDKIDWLNEEADETDKMITRLMKPMKFF